MITKTKTRTARELQRLRDRARDRKMPSELTPRQAEVLRYILSCWLSGFVPSIREIASEHDMASTNGVVSILTPLRRKGYLEEAENTSLTISDKALELVL